MWHTTIVFTLVATNSKIMGCPFVGFCSCSVFCCALLCVHSGFAIILMEREELVALVSLCSCVLWLLCCLSRGAMVLSAVCDCGIS